MSPESEPDTVTATRERATARSRWRMVALGVYAGAFLVFAAVAGLPAGRDRLILWVLGALVLASIGQSRGAGKLLLDFLPLVVVLSAYDFLKGQTGTIAGRVYTYPQLRADEFLFGGTVPTVTLQRWFYTPRSPHVWDYFFVLVYLTYFFVPLVTAALIWKFRHEWFGLYALPLMILAVMALVTYAAFPATPPWLAGLHHDIPHVSRVIHGLAGQLHIKMGRAFGSKSDFVNPVAAVPSLHFAVTTAFVLFFWPLTKRWRPLLVAYLLAMGVALVYIGEHYVFDLLVGGLYAVVAAAAARAITRRRSPGGTVRAAPH